MSLSIDTTIKDTFQYTIDKHLTYPGQSAFKRAFHIVIDKCERYPLDLDIRLLALAQSVISLILLPFKIIATMFLGLTTLYSSLERSKETAEKFISFAYSLGSLAVHAAAIPVGLITVFAPIESIVKKIPDGNGSPTEFPPNLLDAGIEALCSEISPLRFPSRPSADEMPGAPPRPARGPFTSHRPGQFTEYVNEMRRDQQWASENPAAANGREISEPPPYPSDGRA